MAFFDKSNQQEVQELQKQPGLTPRELVQRQIKEYNYHVTEEEFNNMTISVLAMEKEQDTN